MALSNSKPRLTLKTTHVARARRPLDRAYAALSLLFLFALATIVCVGVIQASPTATQSGTGWFLGDGQTGTAYQPQSPNGTVSSFDHDQIGFERQVYALLNKARVDRGLPPLRKNEELTGAAREHSRAMAQSKRFDPVGPDGDSPIRRAIQAGYTQPARVLEAIGGGYPSPEQLMGGLLANAKTSANLLDAEVNEVGVGYAFLRSDRALRHYWTIDLGRRSGLSFTLVVNNGNESTTSAQVMLYIGGKGWAQQMQVSNSPDFEGAGWEPYAEYKTWELSEGTGPKQVYVRLRGPNDQEVQLAGEIALAAAAKGVKPGAPYVDMFDAPRPPVLRVPAADIAATSESLPNPVGVAPAGAGTNGLAPGYYQTSEFMLGKVAVGVVMPQCDGTIDKCTEKWTPAAMDQVVAQVTKGTDWWVERMNGRVSFVIDQQRQVATGYEPINHPQTDEKLWIGDVMTHLGFKGTNYFDQVYAYNNWMRQKYGTDWAFTIFVANSLENRNGTFSNGYFAYSYVPGPFTVETYDNDGYTINNMASVIAHETGHIFGALDQYAGAKIACTATSGYLTLQNQNSQQNCASNTDSIMRGGITPFANRLIDPYALGMVGNRVSGTNGLPDPINTTPEVVLNPVTSPLTVTRPTITGRAQDRPYVPPSGNPISINYITHVKYRVDNGAWQDARPSDGSGAFNKVNQAFAFTPALNPGTHLVEVQATNRVGNQSRIVSTKVTVEGPVASGAPVVAQKAAPSPPAPDVPVASVTPGRPAVMPPRAIPPAKNATNRNTLVLAIGAGSTAISLPYANWTASALIASINAQGGSATQVDEWTGQTWRAYLANGTGTDFTIRPGAGYIVRTQTAGDWVVPTAVTSPVKTLRLESGWTMLGMPPCKDGSDSCYTASSLAAAINAKGGGVVEIDRWVDGNWSAYKVGFPFNDFRIDVGQAYFIRSTKAVNWAP